MTKELTKEELNKSLANIMAALNIGCKTGIFKTLDEAATIYQDVQNTLKYIVEKEKQLEHYEDVLKHGIGKHEHEPDFKELLKSAK